MDDLIDLMDRRMVTNKAFKCGKREEVIEVEVLVEGKWCIVKANIALLFLYTCCWSSVAILGVKLAQISVICCSI